MHPHETEAGTLQSTKMECWETGTTEDQISGKKYRNRQQGLQALKGSSSYFGSDQIYEFRKSL